MTDTETEPTISRTVDEVITVLQAIDDDDGRFCEYEYDVLFWTLDTEYEYNVPKHHYSVSFAVGGEEVATEVEKVEQLRKAAYKRNATATADGLGFSQTALEWLLGRNDAYDHVINND